MLASNSLSLRFCLVPSTFLHHHGVCGWLGFLPCLLTRLSESSDSWPRNKSKIIWFPQWMIKSHTTDKIRYNSRRRHWRRGMLGLEGIAVKMAHVLMLYQSRSSLYPSLSSPRFKLNMSPHFQACFIGKMVFLFVSMLFTRKLMQ